MSYISKYIFSGLLLLIIFTTSAQEIVAPQSEGSTSSGLRIGVDMAKYIYQIIEPSITGFEISLDYEIKKNYFVTVEGGYEQAIPKSDGYDYNLKGAYGRVGFDYNLIKNKRDRDILFVGLRYGITRSVQNASNISVSSYWGNSIIGVPEEVLISQWAEAVFGMKVELFFAKNVYLGWTVRGKLFLGGNDYDVVKPFTIPGYGREQNKATIGATWSIYYSIPVKR